MSDYLLVAAYDAEPTDAAAHEMGRISVPAGPDYWQLTNDRMAVANREPIRVPVADRARVSHVGVLTGNGDLLYWMIAPSGEGTPTELWLRAGDLGCRVE